MRIQYNVYCIQFELYLNASSLSSYFWLCLRLRICPPLIRLGRGALINLIQYPSNRSEDVVSAGLWWLQPEARELASRHASVKHGATQTATVAS